MDKLAELCDKSTSTNDLNDSNSGRAESDCVRVTSRDNPRSTPPRYFDLREELFGHFREDPTLEEGTGSKGCSLVYDPGLPESHPYCSMPQKVRDDVAKTVIREKLAAHAGCELMEHMNDKNLTPMQAFEGTTKILNRVEVLRDVLFRIVDGNKPNIDRFASVFKESIIPDRLTLVTEPDLAETHPYWNMPQEIRNDVAKTVIREQLAEQGAEELIKLTKDKQMTRLQGYKHAAKVFSEVAALAHLMSEIVQGKKPNVDRVILTFQEAKASIA